MKFQRLFFQRICKSKRGIFFQRFEPIDVKKLLKFSAVINSIIISNYDRYITAIFVFSGR